MDDIDEESLIVTYEPLVRRCLQAFGVFSDDENHGPLELYYSPFQITAKQEEDTVRRICTLSGLTDLMVDNPHLEPKDCSSILRVSRVPLDRSITSHCLDDLRAITIFPDMWTNLKALLTGLATNATRVRRIEMWLSRSIDILHALIGVTLGNLRLFPHLETIVLHGSHEDFPGDPPESALFAELTTLAALVELRQGEGSPLKEIFASQTIKSWGVWDALRGNVKVTFL